MTRCCFRNPVPHDSAPAPTQPCCCLAGAYRLSVFMFYRPWRGLPGTSLSSSLRRCSSSTASPAPVSPEGIVIPTAQGSLGVSREKGWRTSNVFLHSAQENEMWGRACCRLIFSESPHGSNIHEDNIMAWSLASGGQGWVFTKSYSASFPQKQSGS